MIEVRFSRNLIEYSLAFDNSAQAIDFAMTKISEGYSHADVFKNGKCIASFQ
jgi:hypothetical protein